jgi:hypothetical protein
MSWVTLFYVNVKREFFKQYKQGQYNRVKSALTF